MVMRYALVPVGSRSWRPWPDEAGMGMAIRIDGWMDVQSWNGQAKRCRMTM
uniref:Uncharacterized protein n=1 Tax=Oryza sativa subsp. indica TaxID=39946 RepID=A0A679B986_ORYSI|nr:hypothetical protein [Oryza sativa Indica Group]BBD82377.1 hypothetical protein [Oryza sativa Indica Group]